MHPLRTPVTRRSRPVLSVCALGLTSAVLGTTAIAAAAVPAAASSPTAHRTVAEATTDAPDPQVLYSEGFEHDPTSQWIGLEDYVGADGETYTADAAWLDHAQCNGIILDGRATSLPSACKSASLKALAKALGSVAGADAPAENHAISAWTADRAVPKDAVQAASVQTSRIKDPGRFISFGVNAAAAACTGYAHPLLNFALVDGDEERPVSDQAIDPCTDSESKDLDTDGVPLRGGSFVSKGGLLFEGDSIRWVMRNAQTSPSGNDGAIDQVTVYDSTPELRAAFAGDDLIVGDTARLTFTVVNTSERGSKPGWSFEDTLPDGLRIASEPNAATTCANGAVDVDADARTLTATGDLESQDESCTVAVDVTSTTPGTHALDAGSVTSSLGLEDAVDASTAFAAERNALTVTEEPVLSGGNGDGVADLGEQVAFRTTVTNTGNVEVHDLTATAGTGAASCEDRVLAVGASTTCTTAARPVTQADVDAAHIADAVDVSASSRLGAAVSASAEASVPTTAHTPSVGLEAHPTSDEPVAVGDEVGLEAVVTNTGNVTLHGASVVVEGRDLAMTCPSTTVAPGASVTCAAEGRHRVDQTDVDHGEIVFQLATTASTPSGAEQHGATTATVRTVPAAPALEAALAATHDDLVVGERIALRGTVRNTGNVTLHDLGYALPGRPDLQPACDATALAPGASVECVVGEHTLTQQDVDAGHVAFAARVTAVAPDGAPAEANATTGVDVPRTPALSVTAIANLAPSEHDVPEAGDLVERGASVRNVGNTTLASVTVAVGDDSASCETDALAPGEETTCRAEDLAVEQGNVDEEHIDVSVTGSASAPDGSSVQADDRTRVALTGRGGLDVTGEITPSTTGALRPGETVDAAFTVRNTGNRTIGSLAVETEGLESAVRCDADELAPGASALCASDTSTVVSDDDAAAGELVVEARAKGTVSTSGADGDPGATAESAPVAARSGLVAETAGPTRGTAWVFSPWITEKLDTETSPIPHPAPSPDPAPAPVAQELAFTGSSVLTALPLAAGVLVIGALGWLVARRMNRQSEAAVEEDVLDR